MLKILLINGPNLNLLGKREVAIYGSSSLEEINQEIFQQAILYDLEVTFFQSNHEGEIVDVLQRAFLEQTYHGIIINAAAYTHTSIAIFDALKLFSIPIIEVHLSDPMKRESFRHFSYISLLAIEVFKGLGKEGYFLALEALSKNIAGDRR